MFHLHLASHPKDFHSKAYRTIFSLVRKRLSWSLSKYFPVSEILSAKKRKPVGAQGSNGMHLTERLSCFHDSPPLARYQSPSGVSSRRFLEDLKFFKVNFWLPEMLPSLNPFLFPGDLRAKIVTSSCNLRGYLSNSGAFWEEKSKNKNRIWAVLRSIFCLFLCQRENHVWTAWKGSSRVNYLGRILC